MALQRLRNTRTGEVRDVEVPSPLAADLALEVYDDGQGGETKAWQKVSLDPRPALGVPAKVDVGNSLAAVGPERHPERQLTQAEIDAGITSWEQKMRELGVAPTPAAVEEDPFTDEEGTILPYSELNVPGLKQILNERGIQFPSRSSKTELIELIEENDKFLAEGYAAFKIDELQNELTNRGVEFTTSMNKSELIELLQKDDAEENESEDDSDGDDSVNQTAGDSDGLDTTFGNGGDPSGA